GSAPLDGTCADQVKVLVPTKTQVQAQASGHFPIVLEVGAELLDSARHIEAGLSSAGCHGSHCSRSCKALGIEAAGIGQDVAGISAEVDFQSGVRFKVATQTRSPYVINARLDVVVAVSLGDVISELILA